MLPPLIGFARDIVRANFDRCDLPYKVTLVATYHCNFRCEMCGIWQKKSAGEMTAAEVEVFFGRWPQFSWVHLTGGELFMRRDLEDVVTAILDRDRALYLLNFPTTGWFGDRTVLLVERILRRGIGRLMTTISIDGPRELHDAMRGLPGSWERGLETFRRLRAINRPNYQAVVGMTLFDKNASCVSATIEAIREVIPDFERRDLHLNIGHESSHYFANAGFVAGITLDTSRRYRALPSRRPASSTRSGSCSHARSGAGRSGISAPKASTCGGYGPVPLPRRCARRSSTKSAPIAGRRARPTRRFSATS